MKSAVATYTGMAYEELPAKYGLGWSYPEESAWNKGERTAICTIDQGGTTTDDVDTPDGIGYRGVTIPFAEIYGPAGMEHEPEV